MILFSSKMIRFDVPRASEGAIRIFDILGCEVEELVSGFAQAGHHSTSGIVIAVPAVST